MKGPESQINFGDRVLYTLFYHACCHAAVMPYDDALLLLCLIMVAYDALLWLMQTLFVYVLPCDALLWLPMAMNGGFTSLD